MCLQCRAIRTMKMLDESKCLLALNLVCGKLQARCFRCIEEKVPMSGCRLIFLMVRCNCKWMECLQMNQSTMFFDQEYYQTFSMHFSHMCFWIGLLDVQRMWKKPMLCFHALIWMLHCIENVGMVEASSMIRQCLPERLQNSWKMIGLCVRKHYNNELFTMNFHHLDYLCEDVHMFGNLRFWDASLIAWQQIWNSFRSELVFESWAAGFQTMQERQC